MVTTRIAALSLALTLAVTLAACGGSDTPERTGRPSNATVSKALQDNAGFDPKDATCVSKNVSQMPDDLLWAIVDQQIEKQTRGAQAQANTILTQAFSNCGIELRPGASTTIP